MHFHLSIPFCLNARVKWFNGTDTFSANRVLIAANSKCLNENVSFSHRSNGIINLLLYDIFHYFTISILWPSSLTVSPVWIYRNYCNGSTLCIIHFKYISSFRLIIVQQKYYWFLSVKRICYKFRSKVFKHIPNWVPQSPEGKSIAILFIGHSICPKREERTRFVGWRGADFDALSIVECDVMEF